MNGRIYDPLLARFMSPDPLIQDPMHSQSYNRYSYAWNNPTNLTDPTGFSACKKEGDTGCGEPMPVVTPVDKCQKDKKCITDADGNTYEYVGMGVITDGKLRLTGSDGSGGKGGANASTSKTEERTLSSYLPWTRAGDEAAQFYADRLVAAGGNFTDAPHYATGLFFSALWTPTTAGDTAFNLAGGEVFSLGKMAVGYAGSKIIGTAQRTGTFGHAMVTELLAYAHALSPNVQKVTMDLGYRRLFDGARHMLGRYGPRPDIAVLYKDGTVKAIEVASKTDSAAALAARNANKMQSEGIRGTVKVNNWAVFLNKLFGK
jgi:hypothetical protein